MASRTLATIVIIFACIIMFPIVIGIVGGVFGIIAGVFGAVFGVFGALIGGFFGMLGGIFGGIFNCHLGFFHWNFFSIALIVLIVVLITKSRR
jgi:hypothetical protein